MGIPVSSLTFPPFTQSVSDPRNEDPDPSSLCLSPRLRSSSRDQTLQEAHPSRCVERLQRQLFCVNPVQGAQAWGGMVSGPLLRRLQVCQARVRSPGRGGHGLRPCGRSRGHAWLPRLLPCVRLRGGNRGQVCQDSCPEEERGG